MRLYFWSWFIVLLTADCYGVEFIAQWTPGQYQTSQACEWWLDDNRLTTQTLDADATRASQEISATVGSTVLVKVWGLNDSGAGQYALASYVVSEQLPTAPVNLSLKPLAFTKYSDDFEATDLDPRWSIVVQNGIVQVTQGQLRVSVPAGSTHDPVVIDGSVRVEQSIENYAKCSFVVSYDSQLSTATQLQGIKLNGMLGGSSTYIRVDLNNHADGVVRVYAAIVGSTVARQFHVLPQIETPIRFLRVTRLIDRCHVAVSTSGSYWESVGSFELNDFELTGVGLYAGNAGGQPAFECRINRFDVSVWD